MTRSGTAKAMIATCLIADCVLLGLATYWSGDLVQGLQIFFVIGGPLTVLVGWRAYLLLQQER